MATLLLSGAAAQAPRKNLLLITLDTIRADHLGSYGDARAVTPTLDRLAREGVRFADATTQAPLTGPAHAALLTGIYPGRYGVLDNGTTPLPLEAVTLATVLKRAGYQTGGFIGAFILDRAFGFDQGFDEFDSRFDRFVAGDKLKAERTADQVVGPALGWLSRIRRNQPFFAWVHLYDAHAPYAPPAPFNVRFKDRPYDGEIAYVDSAVGRLITRLEAMNVLEQTIVVAVADHGESLGEHGEEDHGFFLYDSVLRIPWIMRMPGRERAGTVVREQVRAIDVMPTVLDVLGIAAPAKLDGESVLPVAKGRPRSNPPLSYAETWYPKLHFGWSELRSARVGEWKFVEAPKPELYDLRVDKVERTNVIERQANVAGRLSTEVRKVADGFGGGTTPQAATPDAETIARLRSLGYVGFVAPGALTGRGPDPKDMAPRLRQFRLLMTAASADLQRNQPAAAVAKLKRALAINDRAYDVHLALGDAYQEQRLFEQAIGEYDAAALLNPATADPPVSAALALMGQGKLDKAKQRLDQAALIEPRSPEIPFTRGRLAEQRGQDGEAMVQYEAAVQANASDPRPRTRLANLAMRQRRYDVAAAQFTALLQLGYEPARSHFGLGRVAEAQGDTTKAGTEYRQALQIDPGLTIARDALARVRKR
ncbi:MAG TPA: sulfatase-like hydrolase/transferase [Vicinamibacterales bacterium]|jgi:arylsulfatase A-like enzyme/Tfp pilus assembly protein PilF